ncbi:CotH kinase family protein [Acinetobacter lwoffii]|uniref:CotH kinase family protein n=1 Tax=Acinetobacter lwoffii TaxID=28090 RepID=UPI00110C9784|nr:CotH kinase family protein [Acinetobacter lwoffii]TMS48204.1 hypothetical protein FGQ54_08760 [Acinetobacter lwoffii]
MPIPTPADFRDRTKKHSQVREMMAQMAENVAEKSGLIALSTETGTTDSKLLYSIQILVDMIASYLSEYDINFSAINDLVQTNKAIQLIENESIKSNLSNILVGFQQLIDTIKTLKDETDGAISANDLVIQNHVSKLFLAVSSIAMAISDNRDDFELAFTNYSNELEKALNLIKTNSQTSLNLHLAMQAFAHATSILMNQVVDLTPTETTLLEVLLREQSKTIEFSKLDGFDPQKAGNNKSVFSEDIAIFPTPVELIRIDVETNQVLPTAKGPVINTTNTINVSGQVLSCAGTLEVQGSSSANFPKKNWTLGFFKDESREDVIKVKLGHMMPHDELVFKSNFVDNTHCRNIAVNRLWDQMQMSRHGWPKREPDFVNMINGVGIPSQPTGATGHVDGFPAVMYVNGEFYGLGCLNIGKKRDNYNLKKDDPKHIQLDPEGSVNLYSLPDTPYDPANSTLTSAAFDVRRPATWSDESQGYYDRLSAFLKMSRSGMEAAGIDNYIDRKSMMDYIILCQVCDLWDHLHKNTLYTTWDGNIWYFLPYDVDTVFGLYFTGVYYAEDGVTELRPATTLRVPASSGNSSWGTLAKFRLIYGAELDERYADLRRKNIISLENILQICESLTRKFPPALFEAEHQRWNLVPGGTIYQTLQQTGSLNQIHHWLSIRLPLCDSYFNFSA